MTYKEAYDFAAREFSYLLKKKFIEVWGRDVFLHNLTNCTETYENTNGSMYTYYIQILNTSRKLKSH